MQAILLYWFAAQQQISTFRQKTFDLLYLKFSAEFNELNLNYLKRQEMAKKWLKLLSRQLNVQS